MVVLFERQRLTNSTRSMLADGLMCSDYYKTMGLMICLHEPFSHVAQVTCILFIFIIKVEKCSSAENYCFTFMLASECGLKLWLDE